MSASFCDDVMLLSTTGTKVIVRWAHVVGWDLFWVTNIYRAHEHESRFALSCKLLDCIEYFDRSFEIDLSGPLRRSFSIISWFSSRTSTEVDDIGVLEDLRKLGNGR